MTRDLKIVASDQPGAARLPKKPGTQKLMPFSSASEVLEADAMATSARGDATRPKRMRDRSRNQEDAATATLRIALRLGFISPPTSFASASEKSLS